MPLSLFFMCNEFFLSFTFYFLKRREKYHVSYWALHAFWNSSLWKIVKLLRSPRLHLPDANLKIFGHTMLVLKKPSWIIKQHFAYYLKVSGNIVVIVCYNKFYVRNSRPRFDTVHTKTCKKRWCHRLGMTWTWKFANYSVFFFRSSSQDRHFLAFAFGRTHIFSWTLSSPGYSWVSFNSIFKLSKCLNSDDAPLRLTLAKISWWL